uniref:RNA-directed DNA polymerase, putative n=1 Tax=Medicago truncatula TaxID=3880 RepID=Q2HTR6_MEDTR|nr:RNA-directed DNA polymerase, putative [Medicago truncatula]
MSSRRRHNAPCSIFVNGAVVEGVQPIRNAVYAHFAEHFQSTNVERPSVANLNFRSLSVSEGVSLIKHFSVQENKEAVWDCDSDKSPGPDGINFGFIKEFWIEMKDEIVRFVSEFHRNGKLSKGINTTFIALIPKVDSPQKLNDFRPISLVGSLYKILAKLLANRLRGVIGSVVSESQSAFVKNRQILDGILIANEAVDKAYSVMGCMSFPVLWRKWIKECVSTATTFVLVNGSPTDKFSLMRGLRQGDPLSPFLFLLAAEGLNVAMKSLVDDTWLLGTKSWANVRALRAALVLFEAMSGLKVNFHKSMLVGVNIASSWLHEAASVLSCKVGNVPFLYLGMPIGGNPRRLRFWEPIVNRIKSRLSGWNSRFLSFGGRLVLLKSVLTSLPVYAISFFKAPSEPQKKIVLKKGHDAKNMNKMNND